MQYIILLYAMDTETSWRGQWPVEEGGTELEAKAEEGELEEGDTRS